MSVQIWVGQLEVLEEAASHTEHVSSLARSIPVCASSSDMLTQHGRRGRILAGEKCVIDVGYVRFIIGLAAAQL